MVDECILFSVISVDGSSCEVVICLMSSLCIEFYEVWVVECKCLIEEYFGGCLGYIYI